MTENLSRKTAKIFADTAPESAVGQFGSALNGTKINTTDIEQIQALPAYETGWTAGVVTNRNYPTLEETNGVMKVMSYQTAYTLQKGIPEWDSGTTYFSGDMCKAVGSGVLYVSRSDNNINHPLNDNTYWREYQPSASELPATNYISEMSGTPAFNGDVVTLPAMTLYIPNGRSGNNTLVNQIENIAAKSYTVNAADGDYTLFYNNKTQQLHLASDYITRTREEPAVGNNGDVWYGLDNKMRIVESTNPNYSLSEGVTVSSEGVVTGLGTVTPQGITVLPQNPTLNLKFTTGEDVAAEQSLFSLPYAEGSISGGNLNISIFSTAYGVNYHPIIYTGAYSLQGNKTLYSYTLGETVVYSASALQLGLTLYTDEGLQTPYGTITELTGESITVALIATVYDGSFTLVTHDTYYTYLMGAANYYTSEPLANGVTVYSDSSLETVFGIAVDVEESNVLIQRHTPVYSGGYFTNPEENIYTYTIGDNTVYASGVLIPGLIVYSNEELTTEYGVCENVSKTNVVIHSVDDLAGYVAEQGKNAVPANITIYSDVNLQSQIATSTGANANYTGVSAKSNVGILTYAVTESTLYAGSLSFSGISYNLILNSLSETLLSSRAPYIAGNTVIFGGSKTFTGSIDLNGTNIPNTWAWNGFNTVTPDWVVTPLCKLGSITITGGNVTALNIDEPIELVKMSDLNNLDLNAKGSGLPLLSIRIAFYVDESLDLDYYLNGQLLTVNANLQGAVTALKSLQATTPSLFVTEEEWQATKTLSPNGIVNAFVLDEDAGTLRLPKYPDYIYGGSENAEISVSGNGYGLGLTPDGSNLFMLSKYGGDGNDTNSRPSGPRGAPVPVGGSAGAMGGGYTNIAWGVHPDPAKSGLKGQLTDNTEKITLKYVIRLATGQETEVNIRNDIELNNPYTLFDSKYTEAPLYNASWLLSNGTYYPKSVYVTAYEALLVENNAEIEAGESTTLPSGSMYVKRGLGVKLSTDEDITDYDFIINIADETFRLPVKSYIAALNSANTTIPVVGNGLTLGLIAGSRTAGLSGLAYHAGVTDGGTLFAGTGYYGTNSGTSSGLTSSPGALTYGVTTDPEKSGLVADFSSAHTENNNLNLYYYIGETVQNANLINAGRIEEQFSQRKVVVETYKNGFSWYRVWSDGWIEQGGHLTVNVAATNVQLLKQYKDATYTTVGCQANTDNAGFHTINVAALSATHIQIRQTAVGTPVVNWYACGY